MELFSKSYRKKPVAAPVVTAPEPVTLSFSLVPVLLEAEPVDPALESRRAEYTAEIATVAARVSNVTTALAATPSEGLVAQLRAEEARLNELRAQASALPPPARPARPAHQPVVTFSSGNHVTTIALDSPAAKHMALERLLITLSKAISRIDSVISRAGDVLSLDHAHQLVPATKFEVYAPAGPVVEVALSMMSRARWTAARRVVQGGAVIEDAPLTREPLPLVHFIPRVVGAVKGLGAVNVEKLGARIMASVPESLS